MTRGGEGGHHPDGFEPDPERDEIERRDEVFDDHGPSDWLADLALPFEFSFSEAELGRLRSGGLQPPDLQDLTRHPPRTAECLRIRLRLRDHGDGDLDACERAQVDDHVHACRDCALALSRMELEVLRLRQAFAAPRRKLGKLVEDGPSAAFTRDVMAEIARELIEEQSDAPAQFTSRVMDRVRLEYRDPVGLRRLMRDRRFVAGSIAAAVLLAIGAAFVLLSPARIGSRQDDAAIDSRYVVADAKNAFVRRADGAPRRLAPHERVGPGEVVSTAADGTLRLAARAVVVGGAAAANLGAGELDESELELELEPSAEVVFEKGLVIVAAGTVGVRGASLEAARDSNPGVETDLIQLAGGIRLELGRGSALISVDRVRRIDDAIAATRVDRVRVEILDGAVTMSAGSLPAMRLSAGEVALVDGAGFVERDRMPDRALLLASARGGRTNLVAVDVAASADGAGVLASWTGRVVDGETGRGVEQALVELALDGVAERMRTDAEGWFRFSAHDGAVAIVRVTPPANDGVDLASFGPEPFMLESLGATPRLLLPIALALDVPLRGVVRRHDGALLAGGRVVPCIVDELFDLVDRRDELAAHTDEDGRFAIRGLPSSLAPHESLALLVESDGLPRTARLAFGSRARLDRTESVEIVIPARRDVAVEGLAPGAIARVLREIPGLPLAACAERFDLGADTAGRALLRGVGPGRLWAIEAGPGGDELRPLRPHPQVADALIVKRDGGRSIAPLGRLRSEVSDLVAGAGPVGVLARGRRLAMAGGQLGGGTSGATRARHCAVRAESSNGAGPVRLFAERADGQLVFVGDFDGVSPVEFDDAGDLSRIIAIADDGAVGVLDAEAFESGDVVVPMQATGSMEIAGELRQTLRTGDFVALDALDGPFVGARVWRTVDVGRGSRIEDVPAGSYRLTLPDGTTVECTVRPGQATRIDARSARPAATNDNR